MEKQLCWIYMNTNVVTMDLDLFISIHIKVTY